jgi:hypothetical protein
MERPFEYERAVKHWALLEADERNRYALPPDLWVFSLRQGVLCAAKGETSVEFMKPLLNSWAECSVVISCGKVDYDKSG